MLKKINEYNHNKIRLQADDCITNKVFVTDIMKCLFTTTIDYSYVQAWQNGLKLSSYYQYSDVCIASTVSILNDIYGINTNLTLVKAYRPDIRWPEVVFNISNMIGTDVNGGVYNCYLFFTSVINVVTAKYASFVDDTDIYTSFLFNLLAQSLQIYNYANNMKLYLAAKPDANYVDFQFVLASMIRVILDFSSSNSSPATR